MVANSTVAIGNVARGVSRVALKPCRVSSVRAASTASASTFTSQNTFYPLYPSVHQLLSEKGIPHGDIPKIRATGPKGRLLKGDVLCYIGELEQDASLKLAETIAKREHLDLSNIKIAPKAAAAQEGPVPPIPAQVEKVQVPTTTKLTVKISLAKAKVAQEELKKTLQCEVPLETLFAKAAKVANEQLPLSAAQLKEFKKETLFNEVLGAKISKPPFSRGNYVASVEPVKGKGVKSVKRRKLDIIDVLAGTRKSVKEATPSVESASVDGEKVFYLTVPVEDEARGQAFLNRLKGILEDPSKMRLI